MSSNEEKINVFLKQMGFSVQLSVPEGQSANRKSAIVDHMGIHMEVQLQNNDQTLLISFFVAYVPTANIAPLFRRLLVLNGRMTYSTLSLIDEHNAIYFGFSRPMESLGFTEFKMVIDSLGANYYQFVAPLVQEFKLSRRPS